MEWVTTHLIKLLKVLQSGEQFVVKVLGLLALILYFGEVLSFCTGSEKSTFSVRQASVLPFLKYQCVLSELQIKPLIFLMATHFW